MMKQFINRVFGLIERKLTSRWFNPFATLYVNFRTMPFKQACHLPIYVYGKAKFYNLKGKVDFTCKVKRGLHQRAFWQIIIGKRGKNSV